MRPENFIPTVQRKVAVSAVGPSALRRQGKGVLKASQDFLATISLTKIPKSSSKSYRIWLDHQTEALLDFFPVTGRPWGAARKAINLFLRDALYNQYLNHEFQIGRIEGWLEIPLDSAVARGLKSADDQGRLPQWCGLKYLTPGLSDQFQDFALQHACTLGVERVHLDMYLWLSNR